MRRNLRSSGFILTLLIYCNGINGDRISEIPRNLRDTTSVTNATSKDERQQQRGQLKLRAASKGAKNTAKEINDETVETELDDSLFSYLDESTVGNLKEFPVKNGVAVNSEEEITPTEAPKKQPKLRAAQKIMTILSGLKHGSNEDRQGNDKSNSRRSTSEVQEISTNTNLVKNDMILVQEEDPEATEPTNGTAAYDLMDDLAKELAEYEVESENYLTQAENMTGLTLVGLNPNPQTGEMGIVEPKPDFNVSGLRSEDIIYLLATMLKSVRKEGSFAASGGEIRAMVSAIAEQGNRLASEAEIQQRPYYVVAKGAGGETYYSYANSEFQLSEPLVESPGNKSGGGIITTDNRIWKGIV